MKDTFKKLHADWKAAKKSAKSTYSFWDRMFTDFSNAHEDVDYSAPRMPKFNLALGPALDKLEANKDVDKQKLKATKAAKQYTKEIKELKKAIDKMTEPKDPQGKKIHRVMIKCVEDLADVIKRISDKLEE